jgi:hypothetical protein
MHTNFSTVKYPSRDEKCSQTNALNWNLLVILAFRVIFDTTCGTPTAKRDLSAVKVIKLSCKISREQG